jgi:hypothetical protein
MRASALSPLPIRELLEAAVLSAGSTRRTGFVATQAFVTACMEGPRRHPGWDAERLLNRPTQATLIESKCRGTSRFKERKMAEPVTLEVFSDYV